jgi:uncharacterized membrane protein
MALDAAAVVPAALFVAFLWGVQPAVYKHVLKRVDPKVVMTVSGAFYLACLLAFAAFNHGVVARGVRALGWSDVTWIGLTCVFTVFLANVIYVHVLQKHASHVVSALVYASPAFTLAVAWLFLKGEESLTPSSVAGVALITLGVVLLAFSGRFYTSQQL